MNPGLVVLLDLVMLGTVLLVFAWFHHGGEAVMSNIRLAGEEVPAVTTTVPTTPGLTEPQQTSAPATTETPQTTPAQPDTRTPWQIRFADHFTDEVISTHNSYSSPNISVTIETVYGQGSSGAVTYYVADIYVASLDCFKTYAAHNDLWHYSTQNADKMDRDSGAILTLSGDYYGIQKNSFIVRNGEVYSTKNPTCDICVLYSDGSMETYGFREYDKNDILERNPLQVWNFGPALLDENGKAKTEFNTTSHLLGSHPRSAIGYFEPGHYCFVAADGRTEQSAGMTMEMLAGVFEGLGCTRAYNLDGGASAVMVFNDENYSVPSDLRPITDVIIVVEPEGGNEP